MANKVELKAVQRVFYTVLVAAVILAISVLVGLWHGFGVVFMVYAVIGTGFGVVYGPEVITALWNRRVDRVNRHES